MIESLPADEAHVWLCRTEQPPDPATLARCEAVLDQGERARWQRYRLAEARTQFVLAHGLTRFTLSRYAAVAPADWRFTIGEYGRPEVANPAPSLPLRFNLSHTPGLIALLVTRALDCGVDVENRQREVDIELLARRVFAPSEAADVMAQPAGEPRRRRFFAYWTLKESYIKARGMGLALPLKRFAFRLDSPTTIAFEAPIVDDPATWQFERSDVAHDFQLAVALQTPTPGAIHVVTREAGGVGQA